MRTTRQKFNFILTLAVILIMAQTAWAADQTVTYRLITGTKGVIKANIDGNEQNVITPIGSTIKIKSSGQIINSTDTHETADLLITPFVNGKIKQVTFTNIGRGFEASLGDASFYFGIEGMKYGNADAVTETGADGSFTFTSSTGIPTTNNLTIKLGAESSIYIRSNCDLVITYEPNAAPVHAHNFSFNAVGNTLTATCGHSDGLDCSLADANYQATLTLSPSVDTYYRPNSTYSAKHNLTAFNALTGLNATATDITYVNNATGDNLGTAAPTTAGNYTASVTVTVGGTDYTLTTDFKVNTENSINNNIRQISLNKTNAANDEEITITFTPRSHELVNTLTVTGTTTNMSIGNGVTKVDEYTYTFLMPYEEVTVGATFKSSDASLYKYAITTDITGSGAVDYNAEEYLGAGDAITMTFMPYLQGNLEAGSVVLEGLTVTGATTNMSVGNGITDNGDNTYTFTMPGENVTVTAKAYLSADAILAGTINEPIYIKQGNGIQIGCNNKWTYVNDGALPLVIPDGNTLRLAGGTDVRLDLADKNAIECEGDAIVELIPNEVSNEIWIGDRPERNSGKATIKVGPAGKTLTIRVADESIETVHLSVKSISQYDRNCDVIGCDEGGSCGSIVVESGQVESREYFNHSGRAFRTTDGTITFGYKYPDDKIIFDGGSEGTVKIEDGKQFHSYTDNNTKYSGTINLQGINSFYARPDTYTVTFDENGGSDVDNQTVCHGMKATEPATTREGYTFEGWKNGEDVYDFNMVVTSDLALTAKWMRTIVGGATIQFSASSFEYNGSPIKPELTLMDGETEVPNTEYTVSYADNVNAGTATVTIEDLPGGSYVFAPISKTFEIGKKTVTVTAADQTKGYGDTDPELTYTADGLVGSDEISGTLGRKDGEDVGNHDINLGSLNAGSNYTLILAGNGAKLTITKKSLKDQNIEIGIKDYASCSVEVKQDGVLIADNNYTAAKHATKENTVTVTGTGNYADKIDVTLVSANFEKPADAARDADCCAAAQVSQDMALPEGMVAVMLTGTDPQKGIASAKTLDYIPAGVPVILMKKDDVDGFTGKDITPGATSGTTEVTEAEKAACPLKVADGNTENLQGYQDYVWFKGELVMVSNTAKPANGTFYVKNSTPNSAPRLQIVIGEEEVTTSLTPNPSPKGEGSGYWYTLDGQKMDKKPTKKGLYIKNGRKVVIK